MVVVATPIASQLPSSDAQCDTLNLITAEVTEIDGCPNIVKGQVFEMPEGSAGTLQLSLRNKSGAVIDLSNCLSEPRTSSSSSSSSSSSTLESADELTVKVRIREAVPLQCDPILELTGEIADAVHGLLQVDVPDDVANRAAVYVVSWGVFAGTKMKYMQQTWLFVTRSLFGVDALQDLGPPTLEEIRISLRDSSGVDNTLLRRREYDGVELSNAVVRVVQEYNSTPPPLTQIHTTHSFPWREPWLWGIQGYLLEMAANTYRRNTLPYNAGGIAVNDMDKENPYLNAANYLLTRWRDFMLNKKVEINARAAIGIVGSGYGMSNW